ncbi:cytochrome ubiquinol oxidase subunit II [Acidimangrovimonas sediminis]|uniref:cytochrome ubiquinol oxidase subunit II n=1 Tax=Acidimangrovimonas sediminis TaxID=2056283 RepID=UPI000C7FB212|nr:cytochrome ubiquinol oxidase subunit II [Acidimangrovimonas sediminis]
MIRRAAVPLALGAATLLSGCVHGDNGFMDPQGFVAAEQHEHFWQVTWITLIVVLPVIVGVPWLAWHYRYSNKKATYRPHWDFNHALEWVMWLVPVAIIVVLSTLLWIDTHKLDPYRPIASEKAPLRVQVVGLDWKWLFIYPDYHVATVGQLVFPQDRPVSMTLTSDTVMQSFTVPALVGQIYVMPGMVTKLNMNAFKTGKWDGMNTQYNGDGFHEQHFVAQAVSPDDFKAWVTKVQGDGVAMNQMGYSKLSQSSTPEQVHKTFASTAMPDGVTWFNNVAPGFFNQIVNRYMNGKPVTREQQPGSVAYNARMGTAKTE